MQSLRACTAMLQRTSLQCIKRHSSQLDLDNAYRLIYDLTLEAGEIMMTALTQKAKYDSKSNTRDLVTETDKAVELMLVERILEAFPDHKIIAEEGTPGTSETQVLSDAPTWIIDPIDGTVNFVHGFPHFCSSVALYVNKQAEFAIIYNPKLRQMYEARRGQGLFFNDTEMKTSGQCELSRSLIYQEWSMRLNEPGMHNTFENTLKLLPVVHGLRSLGSAALDLAQVAIGACDAYYHFGPHVWDWAAGVMMVREGGGVVIDPCGGEFDLHARRALAAATPQLAEQIVPLLIQLFPKPRDDEPPKKQTK